MTSLGLKGCGIDMAGAAALEGCLTRNQTLIALDLSENRISPAQILDRIQDSVRENQSVWEDGMILTLRLTLTLTLTLTITLIGGCHDPICFG